jgi:DNA-binding response OmpR family regulator
VAALRSILKTSETPLPDLLFIDISLPKINGYETVRLFKSHPASMHIPIIIISRLDDTVARLKARLSRADAYLEKPFEAQEVIACIQPFATLPNPDSHEK